MPIRFMSLLLIVACALGLASLAGADVWMPSVFGDHMVLQQGALVPVWGTATAGEEVRVEVAGHAARTRAGGDGTWSVRMPKMAYGGPHTLTVTAASGTKTFSDVLVGEVWVASGQSNMQWGLDRARDSKKEIAAANYPNLRLFYVERKTAGSPQRDCKAEWTTTTPETAAEFSAVAYFFGRELQQRRGIPVGLIHTSWGGTNAEAWTSRPALEANPKFAPILTRWDTLMSQYPTARAEYEKQHAAWEKERDRAKAEGAKAPDEPRAPVAPGDPNRPANLYNGMISPVLPFAIRGAIWYQGEGNAGRAHQYRSLFPAMIENWRAAWGQGAFPFIFVQLANFMERKTEPGESAWAELREAQAMTLALPNTGMAVTIDIGEAKDIHPKNKQDVGRRLWYAAERVAYKNRGAEETGPLFASAAFREGEARVRFDNVRRGLMTLDGAPVTGFAIAGPDHKFVWAKVRIKGNTVVISSPQVSKAVAVRYGWADNPECNLYSGTGLPASPFRTDTWPGLTVNNE